MDIPLSLLSPDKIAAAMRLVVCGQELLWLRALLRGKDTISAQRRFRNTQYRCAIDVWEAADCAAKIHHATGWNPINDVVPGFLVNSGSAFHVSRKKILEFESYLESQVGVKFKDNAPSTRGKYNSYYGFRGDWNGGFLIPKSKFSRELESSTKKIFDEVGSLLAA